MASRKSGIQQTHAEIERLLRESEALRRHSEELTADLEALRARLIANDGRQPERRKKPRLRGK